MFCHRGAREMSGPAPLEARYVHTNVVSRDWRSLVAFYERVFGCRPVPPERDYRGPLLDACTGLTGAHLSGMHLRLPGYDEDGPTLEIFGYDEVAESPPGAANRAGFAHIAFAVPDVKAALERVQAEGGGVLGEVVTLEIAGGRRVTLCYATDPEGNVVELQAWS